MGCRRLSRCAVTKRVHVRPSVVVSTPRGSSRLYVSPLKYWSCTGASPFELLTRAESVLLSKVTVPRAAMIRKLMASRDVGRHTALAVASV